MFYELLKDALEVVKEDGCLVYRSLTTGKEVVFNTWLKYDELMDMFQHIRNHEMDKVSEEHRDNVISFMDERLLKETVVVCPKHLDTMYRCHVRHLTGESK